MVAKVRGFFTILKEQARRVYFDLILFFFVLLLFQFGVVFKFNSDVAVLFYKALLVCAGILHGHIAGKIIFGSVNWSGSYLFTPCVIGRLVFYILCIFAYSRGG